MFQFLTGLLILTATSFSLATDRTDQADTWEDIPADRLEDYRSAVSDAYSRVEDAFECVHVKTNSAGKVIDEGAWTSVNFKFYTNEGSLNTTPNAQPVLRLSYRDKTSDFRLGEKIKLMEYTYLITTTTDFRDISALQVIERESIATRKAVNVGTITNPEYKELVVISKIGTDEYNCGPIRQD